MTLSDSAIDEESSERCCTATACLGNLLVFAAVLAGLLYHCVRKSPRKLFWTDEVLTEVAVAGQSFSGMLDSLKEPINAMPPTYFVAIWGWTQVFGTSEFAFRSFSAVIMAVAWFFCWLLVRRFCSRYMAFTAATVSLFLSDEVVHHNAEARCYPMYLAAFFAAAYLYVVCWSRLSKAGAGTLAATFLAHAILVTTHYIGCFYSAALIVAAVVGGLMTRQRSLWVYAFAAASGAAAIVACIPFLVDQATLGGRDNWISKPNSSDLLLSYNFGLQPRFHVIALGIAFWWLTNFVVGRRFDEDAGKPNINPAWASKGGAATLMGAYTLCIVAIIVPLMLWIESRVGTSLFLGRYLLPSIILWPCILGLALESLRHDSLRCSRANRLLSPVFRWLPTVLSTLLVLYSAWRIHHDTVIGWGQRQEVEIIVELANTNKATFLTNDLLKALPVRHNCPNVRFIRIRGPYFRSIFFTLADALDRQHWSDFVVEPDMLKFASGPFLILRDEWDNWTARGLVPLDWRVAKEISKELILVSPSSQ